MVIMRFFCDHRNALPSSTYANDQNARPYADDSNLDKIQILMVGHHQDFHRQHMVRMVIILHDSMNQHHQISIKYFPTEFNINKIIKKYTAY